VPDFALGARPQPRAAALRFFDASWRAKGIGVEALPEVERAAYEDARERYARTCTALHASPAKRRELRRRFAAADTWAKAEARAGRPVWGREAPLWPTGRETAAVPEVLVAAPRARESHGGARRRGGSTSRGGDSGDGSRSSGDDDDPDPPDVARPGRAPRPAPALVLTIGYEADGPHFRFDVASYDDGARLRLWLADSFALVRAASELMELYLLLREEATP
jgi:hypothetical protein